MNIRSMRVPLVLFCEGSTKNVSFCGYILGLYQMFLSRKTF
uniref:Uncharacterized protein n=1 Tax=Anguilla anguilla TaxID=7936 RepID=A0A0E9TWD7_ANGAN